jgi:hypothetical protein
MADHVYDFSKVALIVGLFPIAGFENGTSIKVTRATPKRSMTIGVDGSGRHIKSLDKSGSIEFTLQQGSPSNLTLQTLDLLDEPFPVLVKDNTSVATLFATAEAMISDEPDLEYSDKPNGIVWKLQYTSGEKMITGAKEY